MLIPWTPLGIGKVTPTTKVGWLVMWLISWLVCLLIGWLVGQLVFLLVGLSDPSITLLALKLARCNYSDT